MCFPWFLSKNDASICQKTFKMLLHAASGFLLKLNFDTWIHLDSWPSMAPCEFCGALAHFGSLWTFSSGPLWAKGRSPVSSPLLRGPFGAAVRSSKPWVLSGSLCVTLWVLQVWKLFLHFSCKKRVETSGKSCAFRAISMTAGNLSETLVTCSWPFLTRS